jgi:CBS domain-containing protein
MAPTFGRGFSGLVDLPMVSGDVTVGDALDIMVTARRSAVIVNEGRFNYLHLSGSVLGAPLMIQPTDRLRAILSATDAPYLPVIDTFPTARWADLSPDFDVLVRHGIIDAVPQGRIRIGGLITTSGGSTAQLLAARRYSVKNLSELIVKCVCPKGHTLSPDDLINGQCPYHLVDVACG